jgi:hypothetical protein
VGALSQSEELVAFVDGTPEPGSGGIHAKETLPTVSEIACLYHPKGSLANVLPLEFLKNIVHKLANLLIILRLAHRKGLKILGES